MLIGEPDESLIAVRATFAGSQTTDQGVRGGVGSLQAQRRVPGPRGVLVGREGRRAEQRAGRWGRSVTSLSSPGTGWDGLSKRESGAPGPDEAESHCCHLGLALSDRMVTVRVGSEGKPNPGELEVTVTRGVVYVHSAPPALCPHVEWALSGVLGVPVSLDWTVQRAARGTYRAELSWQGEVGAAAKIASALRGWVHLRFEVTEEPSAGTEGARFSGTPALGIFHAVTGIHGDVMIPEDRLRATVERAGRDGLDLAAEVERAPRQAVGRRARDVPLGRRRRPRPLAPPGRLTPPELGHNAALHR